MAVITKFFDGRNWYWNGKEWVSRQSDALKYDCTERGKEKSFARKLAEKLNAALEYVG